MKIISPRTTLILFAKHWTPGQAKTRLISNWGAQGAAELQRLFLVTTVRRVGDFFRRKMLAYTPSQKQEAFAELAASDWQMVDQGTGDLGQRLETTIAFARAQGSDKVLIIGSDSPDLPLDYLRQADELLATQDAVIGPAEDGGYYLIGFSQSPCSLTDINWGSDQVRKQTEQRLLAANMTWGKLPMWSDVDFPADVDALLHRLEDTAKGDAWLANLQAAIQLLSENRLN